MAIGRRQFVDGLLYLALGLTVTGVVRRFLGSRDYSQRQVRLPQHLEVRNTPVPLDRYPLPMRYRCSEDDLGKLSEFLLPDAAMRRFPISWVYHALRLWGPRCSFPFLTAAHQGGSDDWGRVMLKFLTDDMSYASMCLENQYSLFVESKHGVKVRTVMDSGVESKWSSTHPGKYLQVMAELGVRSNEQIFVRGSRRSHTIADIVRDDAARVHSYIESEWSAIGLARYLSQSTWINQFGQNITFDQIANWLTSRKFGAGACFGCHVPFSLACLLSVHRREVILKNRTAQRIEDVLRGYSRRLVEVQHQDGSWGPNWFDSTRTILPFTWGSHDWDCIASTGHHLEWTAVVSEELRPSNRVLNKALQYLVMKISQLQNDIRTQWRTYLPASHAVKAILTLSGREFARLDSPSAKDGQLA